MKSPQIPYLRTAATHLAGMALGLGLGFAIWHTIRQTTGNAPANDGTDKTETARDTKRVRDRHPVNSASGTELLKSIAPHYFEAWGDGRGTATNTTYASYLARTAESVKKSADELAPADDVAAAFIALQDKRKAHQDGQPYTEEEAKLLRELQPRFLHWLRADPEAALQHLFKDASEGPFGRNGFNSSAAIFAVMQEKGLEASLSWLKGPDVSRGMLPNLFANYLATTGDAANLATVRDSVSPDQWMRMRGQIFSAWPFAKADELIGFATTGKQPGILAQIANNNGKEGADWLMKHLHSDALDPAFKEAILRTPEYRNLMQNSAHIPMDTRLEVLARNRQDGKDAEQIMMELGGKDVVGALDDSSKDWRFAFRNGRATFEEVYSAMVAELPELAKSSPDSIRLQIFKELAEENGAAAMKALDNTPEPDKWTLAYKPTQWMFYQVDPQKFYNYLQDLPYQDPTHHQARLESWVSHTRSNLDLYSRDYVDWVKNMPEGIDREMAAIGILRSIGNDNKTLIAEVDEWVTDPSLRGRIKAPNSNGR